MSHLSLTVEASSGSGIREVCREAISLANRLQLTVKFRFNGVLVLAHPYSDQRLHEQAKKLENAWVAALSSDSPNKIAYIHPTTTGD